MWPIHFRENCHTYKRARTHTLTQCSCFSHRRHVITLKSKEMALSSSDFMKIIRKIRFKNDWCKLLPHYIQFIAVKLSFCSGNECEHQQYLCGWQWHTCTALYLCASSHSHRCWLAVPSLSLYFKKKNLFFVCA